MHARTSEVLARLEQQHTDLARAVESVPVALRERRPSPERWSVAEITEHLALVGERIASLLAAIVADARARGVGDEADSPRAAASFDMTRLLDRSRRVMASEAAQPSGKTDVVTSLARLERAHGAMRETVATAAGMALSQVIAPHPVLGPIDAYEWVLFVGGHEARHTAQIHETVAALGDSPVRSP